MTISDKIVPNLVGVDIGCGMETIIIPKDDVVSRDFDPGRLDKWIHKKIPSGRNVRKYPHEFAEQVSLENIRCPATNLGRARLSIGTLGGGNHFIEAGRDEGESLYLVIHSGSRHLGLEMDNFDMTEFLDIIGVRITQITWGHYELEFPKNDEDLAADGEYLNRKKTWEAFLDEI